MGWSAIDPCRLLGTMASRKKRPTKKRTTRKRRTRPRCLWRLAARAALALGLLSIAMVIPWRWVTPPTTAFMLRERIARGDTARPVVHYKWVPREQISANLAVAVIASEDQKFPSHHGFDFQSIGRALKAWRHHPRGASTISQQVAKNLFLWHERSLVRKGLEAYLTVLIELLWPKQRILEVYLNVAEFGPGLFGAGAASEAIFGKPADRLTLHEAALLTAVLPSPSNLSAAHPSEYVLQRAARIEKATRNLGGHRYLAGL